MAVKLPCLFFYMAKVRKINCIYKRNGRICGNYLGDIEADKESETTFRPCQQCHVSWKVIQSAAGLLTYVKVPKDEKKDYDEDTLIIQPEESDASR